MIVELGHFALVLALCVALAQMVVPAWGAQLGDPDLMAVGRSAALTQFALVATGGAAMALGGALSLTDRRLGFGVAVRARSGALTAGAS